MPAYATLAELKTFMRIGDSADDTLLTTALEAAARSIEDECGRTFTVAAQGATAREVLATAATWTSTPDFVDAPTVALGGIAVVGPRPRPHDGPVRERPYTRIEFDGERLQPGEPVTVTARWGWLATPTQVHMANLIQASRLFNRRNSPYGIAGSPEVGSEMRLLAKLDPDVAALVAGLRRSWGAA